MARGGRSDRGGALVLRPILLPLIVAAIAVPIVAGFLVGGPELGLPAGALAAAVIIAVAARQRPAEPIEVARAPGDRPRLLVVLESAIEDPEGAQAVAQAVEGLGDGAFAEPEVLVVAPAINRPLAHWLSDVGQARLDAQRRLVLSVGSLAAAGLDARGQVGDPDVVQAVEDALRSFAAQEVLFVVADAGQAAGARAVSERLAIPVRVVAGDAPREGGG